MSRDNDPNVLGYVEDPSKPVTGVYGYAPNVDQFGYVKDSRYGVYDDPDAMKDDEYLYSGPGLFEGLLDRILETKIGFMVGSIIGFIILSFILNGLTTIIAFYAYKILPLAIFVLVVSCFFLYKSWGDAMVMFLVLFASGFLVAAGLIDGKLYPFIEHLVSLMPERVTIIQLIAISVLYAARIALYLFLVPLLFKIFSTVKKKIALSSMGE